MGLISFRFRDKRRFQSKIANFPTAVHFAIPLKGFRLEFGTGARVKNWNEMGLPGQERSLTVSSAVWIQCIN